MSADREKLILLAMAKQLNVTSEDLDEIIHELHSVKASKINNNGLEDQIEYLHYNLSASKVIQILVEATKNEGP